MAERTKEQLEENELLREKIIEYVDTVIAPNVEKDGGGIHVVEIDDNMNVIVEFEGHCVGCPMIQTTLSEGVGRVLKENFPEINEVINVQDFYSDLTVDYD